METLSQSLIALSLAGVAIALTTRLSAPESAAAMVPVPIKDRQRQR